MAKMLFFFLFVLKNPLQNDHIIVEQDANIPRMSITENKVPKVFDIVSAR